MLTFPNAKINLGLSVTDKRADGYHDIETVFYPVAVRDALECIYKEGEEDLHISGLPVESEKKENLVWRAYQLLRQDFPDEVPPLSLYLHKAIPMGAGLGGGSADAAFLLNMLNSRYSLGLSQRQLEDYALRLGSDCPFFISNVPCFAGGRGELLEPLALDLSAYSIQVVYPQIAISTAAAFSGIVPRPPAFNLRMLPELPVRDWRGMVCNDFEEGLFIPFPVLRLIKEQLYDAGALYASLSGSGSALYGVFPKGVYADIKGYTVFKV